MEKYQSDYLGWLEDQARTLYFIADNWQVEDECDNEGRFVFVRCLRDDGERVRFHVLSGRDLLRLVALFADSEAYSRELNEYSRILKKYFS